MNSGSRALIFATVLSEAFDDPVVGRPEQTPGKRAKHENLDILMT